MKIFHSYKVDIVNEPFAAQNTKSERTAVVEMFDSHGNTIQVNKYAFLEKDDVYQLISAGNDLNLNFSYVKGFSLLEFRKKNDIPENSPVDLNNLTAVNAFFDSETEIDFSYGQFTGPSQEFQGTLFCGRQLNFLHTGFEEGDTNFTRSYFNVNEVSFQYSTFSKGLVTYKEAIFNCDVVSFVNSDFSDGKVYFTGCNFNKANVAFQFAKFGKGDIGFEKAFFFGKKIDFSKVEFGEGRVDFRLAEFGDGDVMFDECEFKTGKLRFRRVKFGSGRISFESALLRNTEVTFERTEFGNGELTFFQCSCDHVNFNSSHLNNYIDLRFAECRYIDLSHTIVRDIVDLTNNQGNVKIKGINFNGLRNLGRIFIDWHDNNVKKMIYNQEGTTVKQKADQFRMLKEEFHALGQYTDEDKAYLEFKRLELKDRKIRALESNVWNTLWFYPVYWSEKLIFDQIGHYATNPLRVLVSMFISFSFITLLYVVLILTTSADIVSSLGDPDKLSILTKSIYHSAVTFLTIGYGDYYPSGIIRWVSGLEGFAGLFLLAYFTVAFVRKILR